MRYVNFAIAKRYQKQFAFHNTPTEKVSLNFPVTSAELAVRAFGILDQCLARFVVKKLAEQANAAVTPTKFVVALDILSGLRAARPSSLHDWHNLRLENEKVLADPS